MKNPYWKNKRPAPKPKPQPSFQGDIGNNKISGIVENIVYRSEETGYSVCSVRISGQVETITVVGKSAAMWVGENLTAEGSWVRHKSHGYQFQAESITCIAPTSAKGIEKYLASGMIDGIGKVNAKRIVDTFGEDTLRVIEKESKRLEDIEGIGRKRRLMIKESWDRQKGIRDTMIFLQGHGVGTAQSARIFRQYGSEAIAKIQNNPYQLCRDIWGIGFKTADAIAMSVGIPVESELRARAGLVYVLTTMTEEGHCFCPMPELLLQAQTLLNIPVEILADALNYELRTGSLINDVDRIYISTLHEAELSITSKLRRLLKTPSPFKPIDTEKAIPWAENKMGIHFAPIQVSALKTALSEKVSIITGGPGVGKTTIIKALVDVFKVRELQVLLAAPTGRAAKRMTEATGHEAKTLHRLLKYLPPLSRFEHNADNLLEGDVFILDEVSMIDLLLMHNFLCALPDKALLILVGDKDQLPSVGPGNILSDLIGSKSISCTKLETIFRQADRSGIVTTAHKINSGESIDPVFEQNDETSNASTLSDFYFIPADDPDHAIETLLNLAMDRIPKRFKLNSLTDVQILTPMRKNQLGTENLNMILQEKLNPTGLEIERFGKKYRVGDRVMQIRNNYDKEVFNGDIGFISRVDIAENRIIVNIDERPVKYELSELDELIHAYASTIHKSQGSEYPAVIILLTTQHFKLLQRNLLYTAVTRGRKLVCLVGSRKAVHIAIQNNEIRLRRTGLRERMAKNQRPET